MEGKVNVKVILNERVLQMDEIMRWESKRVNFVTKLLQKKLKDKKKELNAEGLTKYKLNVEEDDIRRILKPYNRLSDLFVRFLLWKSKGESVSCVTYIEVKGASAKELNEKYFKMMFNNSEENRYLNLSANPDHYLLKGHPNNIQEVIESTGSSPLPAHFFVHFGEEEGLRSKKNDEYTVQAAGVCKLSDGTPIGGVRHQMKDTSYGCEVKLEVEFPKATPKSTLAEHSLHLACEFYHWFTAWRNQCINDRNGVQTN